jgi:hypothetical protein
MSDFTSTPTTLAIDPADGFPRELDAYPPPDPRTAVRFAAPPLSLADAAALTASRTSRTARTLAAVAALAASVAALAAALVLVITLTRSPAPIAPDCRGIVLALVRTGDYRGGSDSHACVGPEDDPVVETILAGRGRPND